MRVALFHVDLPHPNEKPGGVSVVVHRLANALARHCANVEPTVFSLDRTIEDAAYRHISLFPNRPWIRSQFGSRLALPLLLNVRRFDSFDVLHLHGDDWFFVRRRLPTIRTFHGSALQEARSATSMKRCLSQYTIYLFEHLSARLPTVSAAVGPEAAALYDVDTVVNNGVEMGLFQPGTKTDYPSVLFVGTWEGRKRGQFLFEVFTGQVLPRFPDAQLLMVSDQCPPHEQVTHISSPSDEALAALYRESWVLAHPSTYEGFGIPYIEAMASGTAVLSSPNPGSQHVLSGGTYGVVADDHAFADQLIHLLDSETQRRRYVALGLQRADIFSWKNVAEQHVDLYRRAIEIYTN